MLFLQVTYGREPQLVCQGLYVHSLSFQSRLMPAHNSPGTLPRVASSQLTRKTKCAMAFSGACLTTRSILPDNSRFHRSTASKFMSPHGQLHVEPWFTWNHGSEGLLLNQGLNDANLGPKCCVEERAQHASACSDHFSKQAVKS